jgi:DNA (cytosine-5)-methyltransferase 1
MKAIGLYSGAGGLDKGLEQAGFDVRVALDFDHDSCETLRANFPNTEVIEGDIQQISTRRILKLARIKKGELDLLAGGPPCQPFSKSAFWNGSKGINDPRAVTLREYVRVLKEANPRAFLLENVFGLAYKNNREAMNFLLEGFRELGYRTSVTVVNAADYGIPQIRQRLLIIGTRNDAGEFRFPFPTHGSNDNQLPHVTAAEALEGLKVKPGPELEVGGKWGHLLNSIPPGENYLYYTARRGHQKPLFEWRSRYWSFLLKLAPDKPSWTIQAQPGPYVGPFHWESRRLTFGEMMRIQTFPDDFEFVGSRRSVQKQIGNAVPVQLAQIVGTEIVRALRVAPEQAQLPSAVAPKPLPA